MEKKMALDALAGLAQKTRLDVFRLLVTRGPGGMSPGAIADRLKLPNPTLSFHLKELARANLVRSRQVGRFLYYSAHYPTMNGLVTYLTENCCADASCDAACAAPAPRKRRVA